MKAILEVLTAYSRELVRLIVGHAGFTALVWLVSVFERKFTFNVGNWPTYAIVIAVGLVLATASMAAWTVVCFIRLSHRHRALRAARGDDLPERPPEVDPGATDCGRVEVSIDAPTTDCGGFEVCIDAPSCDASLLVSTSSAGPLSITVKTMPRFEVGLSSPEG